MSVFEDACLDIDARMAVGAAGRYVAYDYDWLLVAALALDQAGLDSRDIESMFKAVHHRVEEISNKMYDR